MCGCDVVMLDVMLLQPADEEKKKKQRRVGARRGEPRWSRAARAARARRWLRSRDEVVAAAYLSPALYTSILMVMFLPITSWSSTTDCGRGSGGTVRSRDGTRIRDRACHDRCARARYRLLGLDPELRIARVDIERRTLCTMRCAWEGAASSCATAPVVTSAATSATIATRAKTLSAASTRADFGEARRLEGRCRVRRCAMRRGGRVEAGTTRRTSVARRVCAPYSIRGDQEASLNEVRLLASVKRDMPAIRVLLRLVRRRRPAAHRDGVLRARRPRDAARGARGRAAGGGRGVGARARIPTDLPANRRDG